MKLKKTLALGLVAANLLQVGAGYTLGTEALTYEPAEPLNLMDTLVNIFPSNFFKPMVEANMLQVIVMAVLLGFSIILVGEKNAKVVSAFNDLNDIFMKCMELILKLSPIGVFCLLCDLIARTAFAPTEVSISSVTAVFGAPVVIYMMIHRKAG